MEIDRMLVAGALSLVGDCVKKYTCGRLEDYAKKLAR